MKMPKLDLRDVHIYGGAAAIALGVLAYAGWPAGLTALGLVLWYMGVYRMGRL
jgi:hypothetical protein